MSDIVERLSEKYARLEVVEDILRIETHPDELRRYRGERSRLKKSIEDLRRRIDAMRVPYKGEAK